MKESFEKQNQHHKENLMTPLMLLNFDVVNNIVLNSMHLLYLGVMKYLMENRILKKCVVRLKRRVINNFRSV